MSSRGTNEPQISEMALAPLPAQYAFVVQLGRDSDPALGRFVGQIEHLASGRQGRFSSRHEMLAFVERTLAQNMRAPSDEIVDRSGLLACITDPAKLDPGAKLAKQFAKLQSAMEKDCVAPVTNPLPHSFDCENKTGAGLATCINTQPGAKRP